MDELVRQRRRHLYRVHPRRPAHPRNDLLDRQRHRQLDPHVRQQQSIPLVPSHDRTPVIEAPTGITFVDYENPPGINSPEERIESFLASDRAAWYNHVNIAAHPNGGHFIPWEIPEQWTTDLVQTFKSQLAPPPA